MTEAAFWRLIHDARTGGRDLRCLPENLEALLLELPSTEILNFAAWLATFLEQADDFRILVAGSIIRGVISEGVLLGDEEFVHFKCWLIAQGKEVFEAAILEPDSLASVPNLGDSPGAPHPPPPSILEIANNALKTGVPPLGEAAEPSLGTPLHRAELKRPYFWADRNPLKLNALFPHLTRRFPILIRGNPQRWSRSGLS